MDYSKVTDNQQVIKLLIQRRSIENQIMKIDSRALINYELERLAEPQANGLSTSDEALPIADVGGNEVAVCNCKGKKCRATTGGPLYNMCRKCRRPIAK